MTRSRFSPLRLIDDWDALYWELNHGDAEPVVLRRTRFAWWCQGHIATTVAIWHVLTAERERMFSDHSEISLGERVFYGGKAIACLLAGWDGSELNEAAGYKRMMEAFPVVYFDHQEYGTPDGPGGCCEEIHVGRSVFKHWYAYVEHESWP